MPHPIYGFRQAGESVQLTMTRDDYDQLLFLLGTVTGMPEKPREWRWRCIGLVNRLNAGNPDFTPYEVPEEFR